MTAETNGIIAAQANKQVAKNNGQKTLQDYMKVMEGQIKRALPSVITPERFSRMVLTALSSTPKLQQCTPQSFLGAMMTAAQLGVEPNTALGQAYLLPYDNRRKGVTECQFQLGYKGLIDLAYRSGEVSIIQAHEVYENDDFDYELGMEPRLRHIPAKTNRGKVICYYAMFKTKDGGYGFDVMSIEDVQAHAKKYSKAYGSGPWQTNFDEMAKKTVLKKVLKYAPLKSDFVRAAAQDESIKTEIDADMYSVPAEEIPYVEVDENGEVMNGEEQKQ
nr:MAG TPA: RecT protein [Caudoviricetes sp.]